MAEKCRISLHNKTVILPTSEKTKIKQTYCRSRNISVKEIIHYLPSEDRLMAQQINIIYNKILGSTNVHQQVL